MNRIISANINGFVFQIDELAYDRLKQYLESLRLRITEKEVYDDIENRIAELFSHLLNTGTPAIFLNHVEDVIAQVGSAEELGDAMDSVDRDGAAEGEAFTSGAASASASASASGHAGGGHAKRLYRNEDDVVVYGVCSGIAAYFGWDPVFVRAIFGVLAVASFGTVILVYVFLMVIIPAASTPAEKLQMRGEPVNFDNLAKVVDQNVRSAYESAYAKAMENVKPRAKRGLGKTGRLVVKVFAAIALVALFSVIVPGVIGAVLSAGMFAFVFDAFYDYFLLGYTYLGGTILAICAVVLVPLIHLIYGLIRILVNGKKMSPFLRWPLNVAFWIALVFLTVKSVEVGRGFSSSAWVNFAKTCEQVDSAKTIVVRTETVPLKWDGELDGRARQELDESIKDIDVEVTLNGGGVGLIRDGYHGEHAFYDLMVNRASNDVSLTIATTLEAKPFVTVFKRSRGNRKSAITYAAGLRYDVRWDSTTLVLPDVLILGKNAPWRNPSVEVVLNLPIGYKANIDRSCRDLISYVNDQYLGLDDMENGYARVRSTESGVEMILP
jgi:phage shock protein PspC (stress-responsive transcriptional regulator)